MIFITAKFRVLPEHADRWPDDPTEYVLVEAFRGGDPGAAHVQSGHFKAAQQELPVHLAETPRIVNMTLPQDDWSRLAEMAVPGHG